jgi:hypothetical protein
MAQDRLQWRALVLAALILRVLTTQGKNSTGIHNEVGYLIY